MPERAAVISSLGANGAIWVSLVAPKRSRTLRYLDPDVRLVTAAIGAASAVFDQDRQLAKM